MQENNTEKRIIRTRMRPLMGTDLREAFFKKERLPHHVNTQLLTFWLRVAVGAAGAGETDLGRL